MGPRVWDCYFSVRVGVPPGSVVGVHKCYPVTTRHAKRRTHAGIYFVVLVWLCGCGLCVCGCVFVVVWLCVCGFVFVAACL